MLEFGILAALGAMLCWAFGDFLIQRSARRIGDIEALTIIGVIGAVGLFPFIVGELSLLLEPAGLLLLGFLAIVNFGVSAVDFEALKRGKLSIVEVLLEIELPVTVVLAFLVFHETLLPVQLGLIALVFAGIVLTAMERAKLSRGKAVERGAVLALVTAVGFGIVNFLTAAGARAVSPLLVIWVPWLAIALLGLLVLQQRRGLGKFAADISRFRWLLLVMGIVDTVAWIFYALATVGQDIAVVTAITESYPAIALLLGLWVNREVVRRHQLAGAGIALFAAIALALIA